MSACGHRRHRPTVLKTRLECCGKHHCEFFGNALWKVPECSHNRIVDDPYDASAQTLPPLLS